MKTEQTTTEAAPFRLGPLKVGSPVILAPMAGVTNVAFRQLCAEQGSGIYTCEMITSRGLVEGDKTSLSMVRFADSERYRSVQLYGVDPKVMGQAARMLCAEYGVDHIDLNFGCPVPKITRKGGGAALPWKSNLLAQILTETVKAASGFNVPVTMKTRIGVDEDHITYLDAGRIAQETGCAAITLHGRTAAQHYSGHANWDAIGKLKEAVQIPVYGNGDIWEAADALAMVEQSGCDAVVIGRGCLGRPWLFADLEAAFAGRTDRSLPKLGEVTRIMKRHAVLLGEWLGEERGCIEFRKHVAWYLKGFSAGHLVRDNLAKVSSFAQLDDLLDMLNPDEEFPRHVLGAPRGRQGTPKRVNLPDGWLDSRDTPAWIDPEAELNISGG